MLAGCIAYACDLSSCSGVAVSMSWCGLYKLLCAGCSGGVRLRSRSSTGVGAVCAVVADELLADEVECSAAVGGVS